MSYFPEETLEELQAKYAELVEFNANMNKELNRVKARNTRLVLKLNAVRDTVRRDPIIDANVTIQAIKRIIV